MKRPAGGERHLERISRWREICPDLVLRSTFIVGFPGETEDEFQTLLDFIAEAGLDRVGCFAYSPVEGAAANQLPGQLPDAVREERRARFMAVAEAVSTRKLQRRVGQVMQILLDHASRDGATGRSYADAPEIDGKVHVLSPAKPSHKLRLAQSAGQFVRVRIVRTQGHDLVGELV
jgi:ribosomal protein S12 methylthiotransferase